MPPAIIVDEYTPDKRLSSLLSEIKEILAQYQTTTDVRIWDKSGKVTLVEIHARIQLR